MTGTSCHPPRLPFPSWMRSGRFWLNDQDGTLQMPEKYTPSTTENSTGMALFRCCTASSYASGSCSMGDVHLSYSGEEPCREKSQGSQQASHMHSRESITVPTKRVVGAPPVLLPRAYAEFHRVILARGPLSGHVVAALSSPFPPLLRPDAFRSHCK